MGIDYTKRPKTPPAPQPQPTPQAQPYQQPPQGYPNQAPAQPPVSLSKVTLTKSAPSVSLTKQGSATGQVRVNLNWTAGSKGGLFKRATGVDLDLACLWEFTDGSKGIVQALGNSFQAPYQGRPIIWLDGDDRSGSNTGGENMYIDLSASNQIRRVLIFAYIYEGTPNWASANGVVTCSRRADRRSRYASTKPIRAPSRARSHYWRTAAANSSSIARCATSAAPSPRSTRPTAGD